MLKRFLCMVVLSVAVAGLSGCNTGKSQAGATGQSSSESLSQQVARHDAELQRLLSQVGQVEQVLPGQAEMWSQMQSMRQELNILQGRVEDMSIQLSGEGGGELAVLKDKVARLEVLVRQMASQLAINTSVLDGGPEPVVTSQNNSPVVTAPVQTTTPVTTPTQTNEPKDTATNLYDSGINFFSQRKYNDAVTSFKDFVAAYPQHKLAGNAYFWQGESYFQLNEYARAVLTYQEVIDKFPGSSKLQSAMLKQGISLYHVNKKEAAKQRLAELVKRYPNSPEAGRAKSFMEEKKL